MSRSLHPAAHPGLPPPARRRLTRASPGPRQIRACEVCVDTPAGKRSGPNAPAEDNSQTFFGLHRAFTNRVDGETSPDQERGPLGTITALLATARLMPQAARCRITLVERRALQSAAETGLDGGLRSATSPLQRVDVSRRRERCPRSRDPASESPHHREVSIRRETSQELSALRSRPLGQVSDTLRSKLFVFRFCLATGEIGT